MALTAEQAAKKLNRTERTVRRWIVEGKLKAFHPTHGRTDKYLVEESEVERLAGELAQYEQPTEQGPASEDVTSLTKELEQAKRWIDDLQRWYGELDTRITALEQGVSSRAATDGEASPLPLQGHIEPHRKLGRPTGSVTAEIPQELPSGSLLLKDFASQHGVNRRTFEDHVRKGLNGDYVEAIVLPNPNRPGEVKRWLTPDQQRAAIEFWKRHNVTFTLPSEQELS